VYSTDKLRQEIGLSIIKTKHGQGDKTYDLTRLPPGSDTGIYKFPTSICPLCRRTGQQIRDDLVCHVITVSNKGLSIWVSDMCNLFNSTWTIAEPAQSLSGRIKHPWETRTK
jgi:hypothetical protein